jgi:TrpR-related protein YerC/YecD
MISKTDNKKINELMTAVLLLKNVNEVKRFLRDLLTESELIEFGNRWKAARMLSENRPYTEIIKQTGLSSTTVARVSKWLNKGMGGYKKVIGRLPHHAKHANNLLRRGLS